MKTKVLRILSKYLALVFVVTAIFTSTNFEFKVNAAANTYKAISARGNFTLAIDASNALWAWGENTYGQVGNGSNANQLVPIKIMDGVSKISAGLNHSLAIKTDGTLWAWGDNQFGQLGDETTVSKNAPVQILANLRFKAVAAGDNHSLVVTESTVSPAPTSAGLVYAFGLNSDLQLGDGKRANLSKPLKLGLSNIGSVAAGTTHSFALDSNGKLFAWGDNTYSQYTDDFGDVYSAQVPIIMFASGVKSIAAGAFHSLILKTDGKLFVCGDNSSYQTGTLVQPTVAPGIELMTGVTSIIAGEYTSFAIKSNGSIWVWGSNYCGKLKPVLSDFCVSPFQIETSGTGVAAGQYHTTILKSDGSLSTLGDNLFGQYGNGTITSKNQLTPKQVTAFGNVNSVSNGISFSSVLDASGKAWVWGLNSNSQLGNGMVYDSLISRPDVKNIFCGPEDMFIQKSDNTVWGWGKNAFNQLGDGTTTNKTEPVLISITDMKQMAASITHTFALKSDGTLYGWGYNSYGQLGTGDTTTKTIPTYIMNDVKKVSVGRVHTLVLKTNGDLFSSGYNNKGQLGNSEIMAARTFGLILTGVSDISAAGSVSMAVKTDGSLWTWGDNGVGQLGINQPTVYTKQVPTKILDGVSKVFASDEQGFAVKSDGKLYVWGSNDLGQLGTGNISDVLAPQYLTDNVDSVYASVSHTFFMKKDGTLWAMGENVYRELGLFEGVQFVAPTPASTLTPSLTPTSSQSPTPTPTQTPTPTVTPKPTPSPSLKVTILNINKKPVVFSSYVNSSVTISITSKNIVLPNKITKKIQRDYKTIAWPSNGTITTDGVYQIIVNDNTTLFYAIKFIVDKSPPKISVKNLTKKVVKSGASVKGGVVISVSEKNPAVGGNILLKNNKKITWPVKGKVTSKGKYLITSTDKAGNRVKFAFSII